MATDIVIACFTGNSGLTDYSVSLSRALQKKASVSLFTADCINYPFPLEFQVRKIFRRTRNYPIDVIRFFHQLVREKPKNVIFQAQLKFPMLELIGIRLLRLLGIKVFLTIHDVLPHYPKPWSQLEYSLFYRGFDGLIVHSRAAQESVQRMIGNRHRVPLLVPHGQYDLFNLGRVTVPEAREKIGIQHNQFAVLFFGHLEPRKGLFPFLDLAKEMANDPRFIFIIAGGQDLEKHGKGLLAQFDGYRTLKNLIVHDRRIPFEDVETYFLASDLIVLPYLEGSTSGVLKLAIAFDRPVMASNVGDLAEQIPPEAGVVVNIDVAAASFQQQLKAGLLKIANNQAFYSEGARHLSEGFAWDKIAAAYNEYITKQ